MELKTYSIWLDCFGYDIENISLEKAKNIADDLLTEGYEKPEIKIFCDDSGDRIEYKPKKRII